MSNSCDVKNTKDTGTERRAARGRRRRAEWGFRVSRIAQRRERREGNKNPGGFYSEAAKLQTPGFTPWVLGVFSS